MNSQTVAADCLFNPRYSDCLKERLIQALVQQELPQYESHRCQGPVPAMPGEAIDSGHLLAMRTGWSVSAGPYPAFRMAQRGAPIITQENLLTVMRARRLGPLKRAPPQPPPPPPPQQQQPQSQQSDTARLAAQLAVGATDTHVERQWAVAETSLERPPDSCLTYRDRKDRCRFVPHQQPEQHHHQQQLRRCSEPPGTMERQGAQLQMQADDLHRNDETETAAPPAATVAAAFRPSAVMQELVAPPLSLSFSYDRFRERLVRWEAAAAVPAVGSGAQLQQLQQLHQRPAGLQIRSVLAVSPDIRGGRQQRRRVLSNPRR